MCPVTCPCFTITGLQTKFDFSSPFFVVDTWNLAAMLPISHFLFFSPLFLLLSAFSYSTCHFCMPLPSLTAPSFLSPPHSPCFTSWTHPSFIPQVSLSLSPFLPPTQLPTPLLTLYYLRPSLSYIFCRWRPAGFLWHSGWRRSRRQYRLGGGKGDGEAGMWGRWLYTSQNHGKRSIRERYIGASSLVIVFCPVGFVHKELK